MFSYIWGRMIYEEFIESLKNENSPPGMVSELVALWWDGKGNWDKAHRIAQEIYDWKGSWVHAYLHRKEGDIWNAEYWYAKAGKQRPEIPLDNEWSDLVSFFCNK